MKNLNELLELNTLIKLYLSQIKKYGNIDNELMTNLNYLKNEWVKITDLEYPMIYNKNHKKVDIKTIIKEQKLDKNTEYKPPSLDNIIARTTNDYNLVNSLYDKNYNSDVPDPYRKRRK